MQVQIPKDSVGIVIGRQGANIKEIQVQSSLVLNQEFQGPGYHDLRPRLEFPMICLQAKTETRINFKDELETEEYRVAAIRSGEIELEAFPVKAMAASNLSLGQPC